MNDWAKRIKDNLISFYDELTGVLEDCGRQKNDLNVLFATKYLNSDQLSTFIDLYNNIWGKKMFIGENKLQDAEKKFAFLRVKNPQYYRLIKRIMIGNLQKNKINKSLEIFEEIWGVDSFEVVDALNKRVIKNRLPIFLEINISGERSKRGIMETQADEIIGEIVKMDNLKLKGVMTMAPQTIDRTHIREIFRALKRIAVRHKILASMGMSSDWQEAVAEGSDFLRIGSLVFK